MMNIKTKAILIIIVTLVIGIFIGAMLNRALLQNRIRRTFSMRNPNVMVSYYEEIIEPDADQREMIREILDKHAKSISEFREKTRKEMLSSYEEMMAQLNLVLTPEQKKRLEERRFPGRTPFPFRSPRINVEQELSTLIEKIGLTENQALQIKKILEESRDEFEKMRQKRVSFGERRQVIEELEDKKEKAIEKILTKDQKKVYEQYKKEMQDKMEKQRRGRRKTKEEQGFPQF